MRGNTITVSRPAMSKYLDTGMYDRQTGKPIGYVAASKSETITVEKQPSVFLDSSSGVLANPVSYRVGSNTFHQNPVYHHKLVVNGSVVLSYKDSTTCWNDKTLDFGCRVKSYPYPPEHPQENKISTFVVSPSISRIAVTHRGYLRDADVVTGLLHLYVGVAFSDDKHSYFISTYGASYCVIARYGSEIFSVPGGDFLPSNEVVRSKFDEELREQGYHGIHSLYSRVREYLSLRISVSKPFGRYSTNHGSLPVSDLPDNDVVQDWVMSALPKFSVSDYESFSGLIPWSSLAADAYSDIGYADNNGIAYLKEATELKDQSVNYLQTLRSVANDRGTKRAKALAAAYLGVHYGYKLTLMDTADYVKQLRKNRLKDRIQRCAATHSTVTDDNWRLTARYQVYYQTKDWGNPQSEVVNNFLQQVDLLPTPENAWDMVPFSFVIDWFVGIGNTLTAIGNANILQMYNKVLCRTQSVRASRELSQAASPSDQIGISGSIEEIIYERTVSPYPLAPDPYSSLKPASPLSHTVEGAALVVQMAVK